ncbi:copper homeostasis periplasmic binding protein CopC [Agitococcus lubricus]|uniref:Copper resistance protein C n=1 Tax=Agitococcus lubricus TaxID=1077255 RepID=A0A2T5J1Z9_9GAMM|nr:copper homeostasis periplasmic binding protein CopC [Agitococcus lubricus]PTQ90465.1 hypothetical protein C8N29_103218 [Agitococcus lubricus]
MRFLLCLGLLVLSQFGLAHTKLLSQSPAAKATVNAPTQLTLSFNEALEPAFCHIHLFNAQQKEIPLAKPVFVSEPANTLSIPLPPLAAGEYLVKWSVVSQDGHRVKSSYSFTVKPRD